MTIGDKKEIEVTNGQRTINLVFEVFKSGAFDYGNRTAVGVNEYENGELLNGAVGNCFDTRYFVGDLNDFIEWFIENNLSKEYKVKKQ